MPAAAPISVPSATASRARAPGFDYPLEALRGVAALYVALSHLIIGMPKVDAGYFPTGIWVHEMPGHLAVLVFFLLSGYVIGLTNAAPITTWRGRWHYWQRRLVRLYPLYVLALALSLAVARLYHSPFSAAEVASWLLMRQGLGENIPKFNVAIWSLGYELLYYLLFLVVSARRWRPAWVAGGWLAFGLGYTLLHGQPVVLISLAYGAVFWFTGQALAGCARRTRPPRYGAMLAYLLLLLSYQRLNFGGVALRLLGLDLLETQVVFLDRAICFSDLSYLLPGVPLLLCFTNRTLPGQRWLERLAFAVPGCYLLAYLAAGKLRQPAAFNWVFMAGVLYAVALGAYLLRRQLAAGAQVVVRALVPLGGVSYALYIVHYPLLFVVQKIPFFSGTLATFLVRTAVWLALTLTISWLLEQRLQPWLRERLLPAR